MNCDESSLSQLPAESLYGLHGLVVPPTSGLDGQEDEFHHNRPALLVTVGHLVAVGLLGHHPRGSRCLCCQGALNRVQARLGIIHHVQSSVQTPSYKSVAGSELAAL